MAGLSGSGALVKGFVTLSGLSGASVVGYYAYSNLSSSGDTSKPTKDQKTQLSISSLAVDNNFSANLSGCFDATFFSGVALEKQTIGSVSIDNNALKNGLATSAGKTEGCAIMKYSEETKEENKKEWKFESKTLIKKDKIGVAIWLELNSLTSNNQRYQVYLLEQKDSNWKIKFGIISDEVDWAHEIKSPDESAVFKYDFSKKTISPDKTSEYSGEWVTKDEAGKNLSLEWFTKALKENFKGKYVYSEDKKLNKESEAKDRKEVLEKWFDYFKDSKGAWEKKTSSK